MNSGRVLRWGRRRAGLTQRELAERTGIAQPTIARIETGDSVPRVDTLDTLLRACGLQLEAIRLEGVGVDRTLIQEQLKRPPSERASGMAQSSRNITDFVRRARKVS